MLYSYTTTTGRTRENLWQKGSASLKHSISLSWTYRNQKWSTIKMSWPDRAQPSGSNWNSKRTKQTASLWLQQQRGYRHVRKESQITFVPARRRQNQTTDDRPKSHMCPSSLSSWSVPYHRRLLLPKTGWYLFQLQLPLENQSGSHTGHATSALRRPAGVMCCQVWPCLDNASRSRQRSIDNCLAVYDRFQSFTS